MTGKPSLPQECINCGAEFQGKFCHNCGQRREVKRITIKSAWLDFQNKALGLDTRFFRTFLDLWYKPGEVARASIQGNRVKYMGPVGYFFIVLTLLVLGVQFLGVDWTDFMSESIETFELEDQSKSQQQMQQVMGERIFNNFRIFQFLNIPFMAMAAMIFFRKTGYNLLEHMVLIFYIQAQMVYLSIVNLIIFVIFDETFLRLSMPITTLYYGFACMGFYEGKNPVLRFLKGILVQVAGIIFFLVAFTIIAVIALIVYATLNPEFAEQFRPQ